MKKNNQVVNVLNTEEKEIEDLWHKGRVIDPETCMKFFNHYFALVHVQGELLAFTKKDEFFYKLRKATEAFKHIKVELSNQDLDALGMSRNRVNTMNGFEYFCLKCDKRYKKLIFDPSLEGHTRDEYNLYRGFAVTPNANTSCDLFYEHITKNVCQFNKEREKYLLDWMAQLVQFPEKKIGIVPVFIGKQGCGKSIVTKFIKKLFHESHSVDLSHIDQFTGRFNDILKGKLIIGLEEAIFAGNKSQESVIKDLATADEITIEEKGLPRYKIKSCHRLIMTTNNPKFSPVGETDRRYVVFPVGDDNIKDSRFFSEMVEQMEKGGLERLLHDLQNRDITDVDWNAIPFSEEKNFVMYDCFSAIQKFFADWLAFDYKSSIDENLNSKNQIKFSSFHNEYIEYREKANLTNASTGKSYFSSGVKKYLHLKVKESYEGSRKVKVYDLPELQVLRKRFCDETGLDIRYFDIA